MADFPALTPTARNFQLGQYPVKTYRAMSGATLRRSFGNRPFGHTLDLQFDNVPEATVNTIIDHYNTQGGGTEGFRLPRQVFAGYSSELRGRAQNPTGIEWLYAEPPAISSVLKDRSTVTVKLVGEIR
jgi:hypothetical protein